MRFEDQEKETPPEAAHVAPEGSASGGASEDEAAGEPTARTDTDRLKDLGLFLPRLLKLVGRLVTDGEVPTVDKVLLGAAVFYVVGPVDIIPDSIPILGQLDDLALPEPLIAGVEVRAEPVEQRAAPANDRVVVAGLRHDQRPALAHGIVGIESQIHE